VGPSSPSTAGLGQMLQSWGGGQLRFCGSVPWHAPTSAGWAAAQPSGARYHGPMILAALSVTPQDTAACHCLRYMYCIRI
jgi:hypothetical protein